MPPTVRKRDLPTKMCRTCGRPFTWRRKWADVWDDVRYCSTACRRARPRDAGTRGADASDDTTRGHDPRR